MENKDLTVPYIVYESAIDKADRRDKRNIIIIALLIIMLVATNIVWIIAWNSYDYSDIEDYTSVDAQQDGDGVNIAGAGDINYGTDGQDSSEKTDENENQE